MKISIMSDMHWEVEEVKPVEEKLEVMDKAMVAGPVAYIGDCDKDISLLQKANVGISRGGVHNQNVLKNSDIVLASSNYDTIIDLFNITKKQGPVPFVP